MNEIIVGLITLGIVSICIVAKCRERKLTRLDELRFVIPEEPIPEEVRRENTIPSLWIGYNDEYVIERRPGNLVHYRDSEGRMRFHHTYGGIKLLLHEPKKEYESDVYTVHVLKEGITFKGFMCKDQKTIIEY